MNNSTTARAAATTLGQRAADGLDRTLGQRAADAMMRGRGQEPVPRHIAERLRQEAERFAHVKIPEPHPVFDPSNALNLEGIK